MKNIPPKILKIAACICQDQLHFDKQVCRYEYISIICVKVKLADVVSVYKNEQP